MQADAIETQDSASHHGALVATVEVICQALVDSCHLHVHTELGMRLGARATWVDSAVMLLRSLERTARQRLSETEVGEARTPRHDSLRCTLATR